MAKKWERSVFRQSLTFSHVIIFSHVITLVLLTFLLSLSCVWHIKRLTVYEREEQIICEPCSLVRTDYATPQGCSVEENDKCCCNASTVINNVVKKLSKSTFDIYRRRATSDVMRSDCNGYHRISGKVDGIDYGCFQKDTRERDLVYWVKSERSILDSISFTNGRFTISHTGHYFVFSQVKYEHDPDFPQNTNSRQTHGLHLYSYRNGPKKLVENTRTFTELKVSENNGTSYIGSVFRFEKYDEVMIKSSHTHKLSGDERENFFGLYILS